MPDTQTMQFWLILLGILGLLAKTSVRTSKDVSNNLEQNIKDLNASLRQEITNVQNRVLQIEIQSAGNYASHDTSIINLEEKFTSCMEALEKVTNRLDRYMDMRNGTK